MPTIASQSRTRQRRARWSARLSAACAAAFSFLAFPAASHAFSKITPERLAPYFEPETVAAFDAYIWPGYVMSVAQDVVEVAYWVVLLCFALNTKLMERCTALAGRIGASVKSPALTKAGAVLSKMWGDDGWSAAVLFVIAYLLIERILFFPGTFYFSWVREHDFGYSVQPLWSYLWDWTKGLFVSLVSKSALVFGLFGLARRRRNWWLWLGIPCSVLMLGAGILDPYRTQIYRDYERLPDGEVRQAITETLRKAEVEYEDVMLIKMRKVSTRVNAFIAGEGPSRRIVLYDNMLEVFSPDEIANAVAHELGHLKDRSWIRKIVGSLLLTPLLWLFAVLLRRLGRSGRFGFTDDRDVRCLPAIFALLFVLDTVQAPAANIISQTYEHRADDYALNLLHKPEAFRSLMVRLALVNASDLHPPLWMQFQWKSHPTVVERAAHAEDFARRHGIEMPPPTPQAFCLPPEFQKKLDEKRKKAALR